LAASFAGRRHLTPLGSSLPLWRRGRDGQQKAGNNGKYPTSWSGYCRRGRHRYFGRWYWLLRRQLLPGRAMTVYPFVPPSMFFTWQRLPMELRRLEWSDPDNSLTLFIECFFQSSGRWFGKTVSISVDARRLPFLEYDQDGVTAKCLEKFYRLAQLKMFVMDGRYQCRR